MKVTSVNPSSLAFRVGIRPGDRLVSVDDQPLRDRLDLAFAQSRGGSLLRILGREGSVRSMSIPSSLNDGLGMSFEEMKPKVCANKCIFCFIHQLPKGMRRSLYVKDEDYRYSFLFGNFLTLTNLTLDDIGRIGRQRLSPLYVSVHATDEDLRRRMLGSKKSIELMPVMRRLAGLGITFHCQIVVCPGYNGGAILERTVRDLWDVGCAVLSVGIVPVGLTAHRKGLPKLRAVSSGEAEDIVRFVERSQREFRAKRGIGFVYAADELYIKASAPLPPESSYDGFPQRENGVGLARLWLSGCGRGPLGPSAFRGARTITVVTGTLAAPYVEEGLAAKLRKRPGLAARVVAVPNRFFGESVSVAGLLTGTDMLAALSREKLGQVVCLPPDSVNCDGLTLDDMTLDDLAAELGREVRLGLGGRRAFPLERSRAGAA